MKDLNAMGKTASEKPSQKSTATESKATGGGMVATANSSVKSKKGRSDTYQDIASSLFNISSAKDLEQIFITAARDGDFAKIEALLRRRNEAIFSIDVRDNTTGNTAVIWAAKRGHVKILEILLRYGADITLRNYEDQTALELASPQTRHLLLESADKGGPHRNLLQAAWQGNAKLVQKILTENPVDINVKNADGLTPLLLVTRDVQLFDKLGDKIIRGYNPVDVCAELLSHRADPNAADQKGKTALHYVSSSRATKAADLVDILLQDGSNIDAHDSRWFCPLHCASQGGNVDVVIALLDGGSNVNARGFAGTTPLHISALNGHDNVAVTLLEHGADVTLVDDSGMTAVDVAKTKRVRNTLKQAWTEATHKKIVNNLAPVRPPTEGANSPSPKRKKGGEVIFDSLQTSSVTSVETIAPNRSGTIYTLEKIISNQEKVKLAENQLMKELADGRNAIGSRGSVRTPVSNTPRKLTPIKMTTPRKKTVPQSTARAGSGRHGYLKKCPSDPARYTGGRIQECPIPVTVLGLDLDDQLQEVKVKKVVQGPGGPVFPARKTHSRNHSDPFTTSLASMDSDDLALYNQGRVSRASAITITEESEDYPLSGSPPQPRLTPIRTPSGSNRDRLNIPDTIEEGKVHGRRPFILDLDRMQLTDAQRSRLTADGTVTNYPNSHKLLPPTPTYITEVTEEEFQDSSDFSGASKDCSPRSDDDDPAPENDINLGVQHTLDIMRAKSIIREGNFNIEETRIRNSDDSGVHEDKASSKSSSVSSSASNLSGEPESQGVPTSTSRAGDYSANSAATNVPSSVVKGNSSSKSPTGTPKIGVKAGGEQSAKLLAAASDNIMNQRNPEQNVKVNTSPVESNKVTVQSNKVTVHSDILHKEPAGDTAKSEEVKPDIPPKSLKGLNNNSKPETRAAVKPHVPPKPDTARESGSQNKTVPSSGNKPSDSGDGGVGKVITDCVPITSNTSKSATQVAKVNSMVLSDHQTSPRQNTGNSGNQNSPRQITGTQNSPKSQKGLVTGSTVAQGKRNVTPRKSFTGKIQNSKLSGQSDPGSQSTTAVTSMTQTSSQNSETVISSATKTTVVTVAAPGGSGPMNNTPKQSSESRTTPKQPAESGNTPKKTIESGNTPKQTTELAQSNITSPSNNPVAKSSTTVTSKPGKDSVSNDTKSDKSAGGNGLPPDRPPPPLPPKTSRTAKGMLVKTLSCTQESVTKSKEGKTLHRSASSPDCREPPVPPPRKKRSPNSSASSSGPTSDNSPPPQPPVSASGPAKAAIQKCASSGNLKRSSEHPLYTNITSSTAAAKNTTTKSTPITSLKPTIPPPTTTCAMSTTTTVIKLASIATTSTSEMTPVTSISLSQQPHTTTTTTEKATAEKVVNVRVINVKPAVEAQRSDDHSKDSGNQKAPANHEGPRISDPFESLKREQERKVKSVRPSQSDPAIAKKEMTSSNSKQPGRNNVKSAVKPRNVSLSTPHAAKKKGSGQVRQTSAGKKKVKPKNKVGSFYIQENEDVIVKTRPKSGKVKKKGKAKTGPTFKDKIILSEKSDVPNRTFISGIGWQIETECDDSGDVQAVVMKFHESDSEDESPRVRPNYLDSIENNDPQSSRSTARKSKPPKQCIPGQIHVAASDGESEEEGEDSDAEVIEDVVEFFSKPSLEEDDEDCAHSFTYGPESSRTTDEYKQLMAEEMSARAVSPLDNPSNVIPQTVKAILDFSKSVNKDDLNHMLDTEEKNNSTRSQINQSTKIGATNMNIINTPAPKQTVQQGSKALTTNNTGDSKDNSTSAEPDSMEKGKNQSLNNNSNVIKSKNTSVKGTKDSNPSVVKKTSSHAPRTKKREEAEINEMIDEILKSTPDPSLSLSWVSKKKKDTDATAKSMTKEDLAKSLRETMDSRTFRELKNTDEEIPEAQSIHCTLTHSLDSSLPELMSKIKINVDEDNDLEKLANKHRDLKQRVQSAMDESPVLSNAQMSSRNPVINKPPVPPKTNTSPPKNLETNHPKAEKSPRFVRKRHDDSLKGTNHGLKKDYQPGLDTGTMSDFGSVSLPNSMTGDDSLVNVDRAEVVTSRLGRRGSVCSRAGSAMTDVTASDEVTIQWKRGNMLGKGAYGTVWCGLTNAGELIAVKQIELNIDNMDKAEEEYEKIQEEVELLKTLKHKNIVGYLGTSLEENYTVSIFMQFVPGGSIANLLARFGALEEEVFCRYTEQILEGISYLHANNVIHRDIKGGNIMLMPNGVIKLIDFGCAKRICIGVNVSKGGVNNQHRLLKSMRGTPYWMAPEVVNETGHGTKSDIWSIGCTIFEMATRKPPWADVQPMAAIFVIGSDTKPVPQLPEKFTAHARDFVNACLTRNPAKRPSATELSNHSFITRRRKKTGSFS